jgi:hypothetical protein
LEGLLPIVSERIKTRQKPETIKEFFSQKFWKRVFCW